MSAQRLTELEALSFRAWPAFEEEEHGGWIMRFAGGYSRRLNSATPAVDSIANLDDDLDRARDWFSARGQPLVVRLTSGMEQVDRGLAERGYLMESPVDIMTADLPIASSDAAGVSLTATATDAWFAFHRPLLGDDRRDLVDAWRRILAGLEPPAAFALVGEDRSVAAGYAAAETGWVGLFQIAVHPHVRRRGLGRAVSAALLEWGRGQGATRAYLQVERVNRPGRALYASLGFAHEYEYWYRRAPR